MTPAAPSPRLRTGATYFAFGLLLIALFIVLVAYSAAPRLDLRYGDTTIQVSADRSWAFFPGDCVGIEWRLKGIKSLYIDGAGKIGSGSQEFCPSLTKSSPLIEVRAQNDIYRRLGLEVHYLPDLIFYLAAFAGVLGSLLGALYYIVVYRLDRPPPIRGAALVLMLLTVLGAILRLGPSESPVFEQADGQFAARIWAEQSRLVFPEECTKVGWSVVGASAVWINGERMDAGQNPGRATHCDWQGDAIVLEAITDDGATRRHLLELPALFGSAARLPFYISFGLFGLMLAAMVFLPLSYWKARTTGQGRKADAIALAGCAAFVLLLYLPFGFNSIAQLESWYATAYFDNIVRHPFPETFGRFFIRGARSFALLLDSQSFAGHHFVHYLLHAGQTALFYLILRKLGARALYAFLTAALFMVYPVNSDLMSTRSIPVDYGVFWLLLAGYAALDFCQNPRRLTFVGMLLALLLNVATYESGLGLIFVFPVVFWLRSGRSRWWNVNLSVAWYFALAFKVSYLALLFLTNRPFYESGSLARSAQGGFFTANIFETTAAVSLRVYQESFAQGWLDAFAALNQNEWWPPTLLATAIIGGVTVYLARPPVTDALSVEAVRKALVLGALLILPAIGALMWLSFYNNDNWRIFFYVPIGAAIAVVSAIRLLTAKIERTGPRDAAVIMLSIVLVLPALSRLFVQQGRLAQNADAKARILYQVVELAPRPQPGTDFALMIPMDIEMMRAKGISELILGHMFDSAIATLYQQHAPRAAVVCVTRVDCSFAMEDDKITIHAEPESFLPRTLFFELQPDDSVVMIHDPVAYFNLDTTVPYDPSLLYDADAPLPPRVETMLGAALRG